MPEIEDGGPAFPFYRPARDDAAERHSGITKRELFAAILMHSEAVTCGVPGEACEALVEASREAGTDVIDHMAMNAVQGADALLRALSGPTPAQHRELHWHEQNRLDAADRLAKAVEAVKQDHLYMALPTHLREPLERALDDVTEPEIPF